MLKFFTVSHYNHTAPSNIDATSNFLKLHQLFQKLHPTTSQHMTKCVSLPTQNIKRQEFLLSNIFQTGLRPTTWCNCGILKVSLSHCVLKQNKKKKVSGNVQINAPRMEVSILIRSCNLLFSWSWLWTPYIFFLWRDAVQFGTLHCVTCPNKLVY